MHPDYLISTPENVDLHLELAGLGNRIMACLVDTIYTYVALLVLLVLTLGVVTGLEFFPIDSATKAIVTYSVIGVSILASLTIYFGYYIFFEGLWHGQTPGKRTMRIRVIEQSGQPISWASAFIRNLLRVVDIGIGLVGLLVMIVDLKERRLGDLAAGTLVIREHLSDEITGISPLSVSAAPDSNIDAGRVSPRDYDLLVSFLERRTKLSPPQREVIAERLARYFQSRLQVESSPGPPEPFLEQIYLAYHKRADQASEHQS